MKRSASEQLEQLELRVARLEKQSGLLDYILGPKEERFTKAISKKIIAEFNKYRNVEDVNLNIGNDGLLSGSLSYKARLFRVSSVIDKNAYSRGLPAMFVTLTSASNKLTHSIEIFDPDNWHGGHYIEKPKMKDPNVSEVPNFVKVVLNMMNRSTRSKRASTVTYTVDGFTPKSEKQKLMKEYDKLVKDLKVSLASHVDDYIESHLDYEGVSDRYAIVSNVKRKGDELHFTIYNPVTDSSRQGKRWIAREVAFYEVLDGMELKAV